MTAPKKAHGSRVIDTVIYLTCASLLVAMIGTLARRSPQEPGDETRHTQALTDVKKLAAAVEQFAADNRKFPRKLEDLTPKYLQSVPLDPYQNHYRIVDGGHQVWVAYYGKDGRPKGFTPMDMDVMNNVQMPPPRKK